MKIGVLFSGIFLFILFGSACVHQNVDVKPTRTIQGVTQEIDLFNTDPLAWLEKVRAVSTESLCAAEGSYYANIMDSIDFENIEVTTIKNVGRQWLKKSFDLKVSLNRKLPLLTEECREKMVPFFRSLRQLEDYVGELTYAEKDRNASDVDFTKVQPPILNPKAYSPYQLADDYKDGKGFKFEAGDVLITRGVSFVSSSIAQSALDRSHFSHGVFVHKAPNGQMKTIESYLQVGVAYYSLVDAMKNENARILVFRSKDPELGAKASQIMGKTLDEKIKQEGGISYDYDMNFVDHKKMNCIEVIVAAYEWASGGKVIVPSKKTDVRYSNPYVLGKLHMPAGPTFSPIDMEKDPRFDLVLEWRDYSLVRDQRQKDMLTRKIFDWMEKDGYHLFENFTTFALRAAWLTRPLPGLWSIVSKPFGMTKIPADTPKSFLIGLAQMRNVGQVMLEEVKKADLDYQRRNKRPMTEKQLLAYLEEFRARDAENFKSGRSSVFHQYFRPEGMVKDEPSQD